jgi:tungstate transport system ATP-binding protein
VIATQNLGQARRLAADVAFILRGRVHELAPAERFFHAPQTAEAAAFLNGDLVV